MVSGRMYDQCGSLVLVVVCIYMCSEKFTTALRRETYHSLAARNLSQPCLRRDIFWMAPVSSSRRNSHQEPLNRRGIREIRWAPAHRPTSPTARPPAPTKKYILKQANKAAYHSLEARLKSIAPKHEAETSQFSNISQLLGCKAFKAGPIN